MEELYSFRPDHEESKDKIDLFRRDSGKRHQKESRQLRREITPSEDRLLSIDEEVKEEEAQPDPKRELDSHQGEDYDRMEPSFYTEEMCQI